MNKKINLFIISQCIIMFNFFLCCLRIYASTLVGFSYLLIGVAVVLFLLSGVYKSFKFSFVPVAFLILLGYMILTDAVNSNFSSFECLMAIACCLLCYSFSFFINDREDNIKSLTCLFYVCLACSTIMSLVSLAIMHKDPENLDGISMQRNVLASCQCMAVIGSFWLIDLKKKKTLAILPLTILNLYSMIRTRSRTQLIVLMVFIIIMLIYYAVFAFRKKHNRILVYCVFIILGLLIAGLVLGFVFKRNAVDFGSGSVKAIIDRISSGRIAIWDACFDLIASSPVTGVNNNTFHQKMMDTFGEDYYHQHSVYIGLMTIHGIPSLVIYVSIIIYTIFNSLKLIFSKSELKDTKRYFFYLAFLAGLLFGDCFESYTLYSFIPCAYWVFLMFSSIETERLNRKETANG